MIDSKKKNDMQKVDTKEFELPETLFVRDIENRVFQGIILQCLSSIEGIALVEGHFIKNIFDRSSLEGIKGIHVEQDNRNHSVNIKIEVNVYFGYSIPQKAEEIQTICSQEITKLTGLHVSHVHVVFKNILLQDQDKKMTWLPSNALSASANGIKMQQTDEYNDEF